MTSDLQSLIEDELVAIRQSGEMPEVAFHSALHYLQEDPDGPRARLDAAALGRLVDAVEARYLRILMRDLNPRYREKPIYRGIGRAVTNWQRLARFARREGRDLTGHRRDAAEALRAFLAIESREVAAGRPPAAVDCTPAVLAGFAGELELTPRDLPEGWEKTCAGRGR